ncbi:MAG: hypothetical protein EAZ60_25850 [Oscillatoriales cyanobacterium]|nr:MAG: hypothetical protein EAZ83_23275 [Oscillatoriales cyanobacterium]TAE96513.1 MAG: hypothetical protein EAZ79_14540 [Oscillatoriales cyanobacterium]TAF16446.1 MAG: hypothetical protein EAZ73_24620 [Oscillatoriales cyanobacterium]TAF35354.1 MAG: hypothetical protein EAZ69_13155 [Oscillatoriales cyanobacterium]TAF51580.1 MAG: hypothetical protein EAZ60_25850 [Oscillatoriales cyanobacterium]
MNEKTKQSPVKLSRQLTRKTRANYQHLSAQNLASQPRKFSIQYIELRRQKRSLPSPMQE